MRSSLRHRLILSNLRVRFLRPRHTMSSPDPASCRWSALSPWPQYSLHCLRTSTFQLLALYQGSVHSKLLLLRGTCRVDQATESKRLDDLNHLDCHSIHDCARPCSQFLGLLLRRYRPTWHLHWNIRRLHPLKYTPGRVDELWRVDGVPRPASRWQLGHHLNWYVPTSLSLECCADLT